VPRIEADAAADSAEARARELYRAIVPRYDLLNTLLTFGCDRLWRDRSATLAAPRSGQRWLDLGCGTGAMVRALLDREAQLDLVGLDLTPEMLDIAGRRLPQAQFYEGSALALPFMAQEFDGVVSAFALRPLPDLAAALAEARRVLRPGGRFVALEAARPPRWLHWYFRRWVPWLGGRLSSRAAYAFLPRSLATLPPPTALCEMLATAGFANARVVRLGPATGMLLYGERP